MNNDNHSVGSGHGNNFFSGFLLGAIVGAAVIFLLGTKKGKKILKIISEKGWDNISNVFEKIDESTDLENGEFDNDPSLVKKDASAEAEGQKKDFGERRKLNVRRDAEERPKPRRFFRGISRHLN